MTFKIGDKVEVVEKYDAHEVGEVGTITSISSDTNPFYRINDDKWGAHTRNFKKVEGKPMFKVGDKVEVLNNDHSPDHYMVIGSVAEVVRVTSDRVHLKGKVRSPGSTTQTVNPKCVEKVDDLYEDEWHLNNGKVTIPDDAYKPMDGGSVVAFRKRKVKDLEFGDELVGRITGMTYKFIRYTNHLKTHCDALNSANEIATSQSLTNHLKRK